MKKYLIGMLAMIMIVVASSFALMPKKPDAKAENTYWFLMDASGTQITSTQLLIRPLYARIKFFPIVQGSIMKARLKL